MSHSPEWNSIRIYAAQKSDCIWNLNNYPVTATFPSIHHPQVLRGRVAVAAGSKGIPAPARRLMLRRQPASSISRSIFPSFMILFQQSFTSIFSDANLHIWSVMGESFLPGRHVENTPHFLRWKPKAGRAQLADLPWAIFISIGRKKTGEFNVGLLALCYFGFMVNGWSVRSKENEQKKQERSWFRYGGRKQQSGAAAVFPRTESFTSIFPIIKFNWKKKEQLPWAVGGSH